MYKIKLTSKELNKLKKLRNTSSGYLRERISSVIMNSNGLTARRISSSLGRTYDTVLGWLKMYTSSGINGLHIDFAGGRPATLRSSFKNLATKWFLKTPSDYEYVENIWTVKLLIQQYKKETQTKISEDTVERALNDLGYSFKRPKKALPEAAPSKTDKLESIITTLAEIEQTLEDDDVDVFIADESHFSNEPYLIKGWHKKGVPFFPKDTSKKSKLYSLWCVESKNKRFYLAKCR